MTDTPTPAVPGAMAITEALARLDAAATPVPWEAQFSKDWKRVVIRTPDRVIVLRGFSGEYENEANDQMLVAAMRNALPDLLSELTMVRKSLERTAIGGNDLEQRLVKIAEECRDNISGAEEDRSRDTLLTEIIAIAEGRPTPAPTGSETT